jgi:predicted RND superfamily exporter protein
MNQYLRAGALTAGMMAIIIAVTGFFHWLSRVVTPDMAPMIVICLGITSCIFLIYMMFLAQIRYQDEVKKIAKK